MSGDFDAKVARIASWLEEHARMNRCEEHGKYARTLSQAYDVEDLETCVESDFLAAGMRPVHANRAAKATERLRESRKAASPSQLRTAAADRTSSRTTTKTTKNEVATAAVSAINDENDETVLIVLKTVSDELRMSTEVSLFELCDAVADLSRGAPWAKAGKGVTLIKKNAHLTHGSIDDNGEKTVASKQATAATPPLSPTSPPCGTAGVLFQLQKKTALPGSPTTPGSSNINRKKVEIDSARVPIVDFRQQPESNNGSGNDGPKKPLEEWTVREVSRWIRGFEKLRDHGAPPKLVDGKMLCRIRSRADVESALGIRIAVDQFFLLRELSKMRSSHESATSLVGGGSDSGKYKSSREQLPPIASFHDSDLERSISRRHTWTNEEESSRARRGPSSGEREKDSESLSPSNARVPHLSNYAEYKPPNKPVLPSSKVRTFSKPPVTKCSVETVNASPEKHAAAVIAAGPESPPEGVEREDGVEALRLQVDLGLQMDLAAIDKDVADQFEQSYEFSDDGTLLDWRSGLEITGGKLQRTTTAQIDLRSRQQETREEIFSPIGNFADEAPRNSHSESNTASSNIPKADRIIAINAEDLVVFDELGRGACASVRKALHVPSLTLVAVKMVPVHDDSRRRQLLRELAALHQFSTERLDDDTRSRRSTSSSDRRSQAALRKHIVAFHGAFTNPTAGCVCAVLEYMDARSVHDAMEARNWEPLDLDSVSVIAHGCVAALAALHADRQLHRDVKPSNVLLDWRWRVKLSDFGVSRAVDNTLGIAQTYIGTLAFMAPERIVGSDYSFPSDMWSIGLCFATVALGRVPLPQRDGYWAVVRTICDGDPPRLDPEQHDASLCQLTNACLSRAPGQRPAPAALLDHPFVKRGEDLIQRASRTLGTPDFQFPVWQKRRSAEDTEQHVPPESLVALHDVARKANEWRANKLDLDESKKARQWQEKDLANLAEQLHISVETVSLAFQEEAGRLSRSEILEGTTGSKQNNSM